jgi:hypothetical protein
MAMRTETEQMCPSSPNCLDYKDALHFAAFLFLLYTTRNNKRLGKQCLSVRGKGSRHPLDRKLDEYSELVRTLRIDAQS